MTIALVVLTCGRTVTLDIVLRTAGVEDLLVDTAG